MKCRLTIPFGVIGLALVMPAVLASQSKMTAAPKLRLPPYDKKMVLEITAARVDALEKKLNSVPSEAEEERRRDEANAAREKWRECRRTEESAVRAAARPQVEKDQAQIEANSAQMKKLAKETEARMKAAKSHAEMQQILAEFQEKQKAMMPQSVQDPDQAVARQADAQQDIAAKCGEEPPDAARAARVTSEPGMALMVERIAGACREPATFVGPDGSLSISEVPFNMKDKGMAQHYNVEIYSPAEYKLLQKRCPTLMPLIQSRGNAIGVQY